MVQSVAIVALPVGYSMTGGSFSLGLDLSIYGLGFVNTPIPIQFNAIGERFEENSGSAVVGRQSGQSVQSKPRIRRSSRQFVMQTLWPDFSIFILHGKHYFKFTQ